MKLLVIANNPLVLRMVRSVLGHAAHEIRECRSLADAALNDAYRPDLILADWDLVDANIGRVASLLRSTHPDVSVVVLGDCDNEEIRGAALDAGAVQYVLKEDMLDLLALMRPPLRGQME